MLRLIDRINRKIPRMCDTKDTLFVLNVIPLSIDKDNDDVVQIIGYHKGQPESCREQFIIDKLYFTDDMDNTIAECIAKGLYIRMMCVKYRSFNNALSKMYNTWKVIEMQKAPNSTEFIQIDQHSKLF